MCEGSVITKVVSTMEVAQQGMVLSNQTISKKGFCPKNYSCPKFHHKSSLYPKSETTEQVQAKSDGSWYHSY